ncbi:hypothetical protein ONZ45_g19403 [Pleurotus djamor]|nr:hypothetical protein ONZ45_g19403 [Pleurotus djamor]
MRLGPTTDHTTFDAEAVGLLLAAGEIQKERLTGNAAIFMDNKSVIQRLQTGQRGTGQYLLNSVENLLTKAKHQAREEGRNLSISLHWISAHDDVTGNERADELAKEAARGREHRPDPLPGTLREYFSLPLSKSAKKQFAKARRKHQSWDDWVKSKRKPKLDHIDEKLTDDKYMRQVGEWRKGHVSIITQLRTQHIPLNLHLYRIGKSEMSNCPHCPRKEETVQHLLQDCPAYNRERQEMATTPRWNEGHD